MVLAHAHECSRAGCDHIGRGKARLLWQTPSGVTGHG